MPLVTPAPLGGGTAPWRLGVELTQQRFSLGLLSVIAVRYNVVQNGPRTLGITEFDVGLGQVQFGISFVGITLALGLHAPNWVPKTSGFNYEPSPYLKPYEDLRKDFTVISGTSLPGSRRV